MAWFWIENSDETLPYVMYDNRINVVQSHDLTTNTKYIKCNEKLHLTLERNQQSNFPDLHSLHSSLNCPLVDGVTVDLIKEYVNKNDFQLFSTELYNKKKFITDKYKFVKPLREIDGIDFTQTKIKDWVLPDIYFQRYETLRLKDNCLGNFHYARLKYSRHILISDTLKQKLEAITDPSKSFLRDFEMKSMPWWR